MSSDPSLKKEEPTGPGNRRYTDEQYRTWLDEMRPHLELGCSLYRATMKAAIEPHYTVILRKYQIGDWFAQKIDSYRSMPGENVNEALSRLSKKITDRVKADEHVSKDDFDILKFMAEKHRTAQPFFVSRTESADVSEKPVGKVLDVLESNYDELADKASQAVNGAGSEASGQVVATDPSVQNSGQEGQSPDVQTESSPTPSPGGAPEPQA